MARRDDFENRRAYSGLGSSNRTRRPKYRRLAWDILGRRSKLDPYLVRATWARSNAGAKEKGAPVAARRHGACDQRRVFPFLRSQFRIRAQTPC